MRDFTFWSAPLPPHEEGQPSNLAAGSVQDAVREADRLWASSAQTRGPAQFTIYDDATGRLIYERSPGPSC